MTATFKRLTVSSLLFFALTACASRSSDRRTEDLPECRQAAKAVVQTDLDNRLSVLQRRADVYSDCMEAHGYTLDQEEFERRLLHKEQVRNSDPLGGDPAFIIAAYRQELRMEPALWRPRPR
jgi:hypothetical protein